jgi:phosphoribosylanthranilate isomerase
LVPTAKPRVKICCIASIEEATMAISYGASAIGLVSAMPSGPGPIPEELIHRIAIALPPTVDTFLLTSLTDPGAIIAQHRRCRTTTLQLCDRQGPGCYKELRKHLRGIKIVQVIHVEGEASIRMAQEIAEEVDALLLDSGKPDLPVKELGGTGRVHDWSISRKIRESLNIPIYLAGGSNAGNIEKAIQQISPFGLDVCSGVRTNGLLDESKLSNFFSAINRASSGYSKPRN